ncbi:MAG TPA: hypothetical protein VEZ70_07095 [Allosphingosinicella sp.]|nr:hypothetical protein [Allosphingosinicella sp.]
MRLGSLLLVEERLLEANYFVDQMEAAGMGLEVGYNLNAFLSASRAVTFLLQKEMSRVVGFAEWWADRQVEMRADPAMEFFVELRNFSQKAGRVRFESVGFGVDRSTYRHIFRDGSIKVPEEVGRIDALDACRLHLAKVAGVVIGCMDTFPFHTCPRRAVSPAGIAALCLDTDELDASLGYPRGYSRSLGNGELQSFFLGKHFDEVDRETIEYLANVSAQRPLPEYMSNDAGTRTMAALQESLADYWSELEKRRSGGDDI